MVNSTLGMNTSDSYLPVEFRWTATFAYSATTVVGIIGNLMVVAVVLSIKGMMTATNCYLVSLAVADSLCFVSSIPAELSWMHLPEDVYVFGDFGCRVLTFLSFLAINASSLSIAAFTLERYIGICHPMQARLVCSVQRSQVIIVFIWIFSILYNSSWIVLTGLSPLHYVDWPEAQRCTFRMKRDNYKAVFIADIVLFYFIPFITYIFVYSRIFYVLYKAESVCGENEVTTPQVSRSFSGNAASRSSRKSVKSVRMNRSRVQIAKMLIVIVTTFGLCWLPYRALVVFNSFIRTPWIDKW
ncbi:unnamed protein product [Soboliphyme baturini]|uniref:Thyrotropin-releasing hormone receptor n=1 Tax=Soboliphyme baturini TaxID=241478 RepID=A0A183J8Y6_9BILA|nr:unnamed protein product [Soboliphyme baturini]